MRGYNFRHSQENHQQWQGQRQLMWEYTHQHLPGRRQLMQGHQ
ncbi:MAG: hypothetical protein M0T70_12575 [Geobacteraceae bacterium]|nr:hypothetical protein [Geobacteraceae bacterium]